MATKTENVPGNMVLVNASLLGQGLKTTFMGMAMVFDSLGASGASGEIMKAAQAAPVSKPDLKQEKETVAEEDLPFDTEPKESAETASVPENAADKPSPTPTGTIDDITKVIVAKIKKKRDNNARIGALLKSYGVEKVSGLPLEKYEAFLTDISEL